MTALFESLLQRDVRLRNRIVVSPMCQYSAVDGMPDDWHLVHLGSRAVGGAGVVFTEATAVSAEGRISPDDTGLWSSRHQQAWSRIAAFVAAHGAVPAIQLAHAGRKASTFAPWKGEGAIDEGSWIPVAPSALAFNDKYPMPQALDADGIAKVVADFRSAAQRALDAGFRIIELHAAHGYLLHQFLSPLSNRRDDAYGGGFDNRTRLLREVIAAIRVVWPESLPLWLRISATDWVDGGWDAEQSIELCRSVGALGVDLVDVSSGGLAPQQKIPLAPGYQVPFAARIRREANIATGAVGLITEPAQAERILVDGDADVIVMARELLRDPYFPRRAAKALEETILPPAQYLRAW
jgi:2,4-dienoyl-CoA reductase-like NADH-dependent reductase (Old Yellow Enzyme family)